MAILINTKEKISDHWTLIQSASGPEVFSALRGRNALLPLALFLSDEEEAASQFSAIGVWLDSHQNLDKLENRLSSLPIIALNFPVFSDGRPYSLARRLRRDLGYTGEIRAIGDVLRDQLCFLKSCGFDSFALRSDQEPEDCLNAFSDFSTSYTSTVVNDIPLFRRRG
jgi:uncharacterized protein (DUF934 family)